MQLWSMTGAATSVCCCKLRLLTLQLHSFTSDIVPVSWAPAIIIVTMMMIMGIVIIIIIMLITTTTILTFSGS